jgi:L-lactate dehydrogenase
LREATIAGSADSGVKVVIVGAGAVGSAFAYRLVVAGLAEDIVLIDRDGDRAAAEAMDLNHGLPFAPPTSVWAGDYPDCRDAGVVVITAGAAQEPGETRLDLIGRNSGICRSIADRILEQTDRAVLVMVTNPVDVLTYDAIRHTGLAPDRVLGSGTVLDSARFRFLLSRHCGVDARNVHAYVLGEHGDSEVAAWSMVHIAGMQLDDYCHQCGKCRTHAEREQIFRQVRESAYHLIESKGFTNYGIASALLRIVGAIVRDEHSVLTVSSLLAEYLGVRDVCMSIPCVVGRQGIIRQLQVDLSPNEADELRRSAGQLKEVQDSLPPQATGAR